MISYWSLSLTFDSVIIALTLIEIIYFSGNYKVNQRQIEVAYTEVKEVIYGDSFEITNIHQDIQTGESIKIIYGKQAGLGVGEYSIVSAQTENLNYYALLDATKTTGFVRILPRGVEISVRMGSMTYDGNAKNVELFYTDVVTGNEKNIDYDLYSNNEIVEEAVNAGSYVVKVTSLDSENYYILEHEDLTTTPYSYSFVIAKALPTISKVSYQTVTYTGAKLLPHIVVNNTEQTPTYRCLSGNVEDSNGCINVGVYEVAIEVEESDNYLPHNYSSNNPWTVRFTIEARIITLSPKLQRFYYNDEVVVKEDFEIENASGVKEQLYINYSTTATKGSLPGKYAITSAAIKYKSNNSDNMNYRASIIVNEGVGKVEILKRPIKLVYFDYTDLVYNGKIRNIGVRAVDVFTEMKIEDINLTIVCDEGEIKDAKTYHIRAHFEDARYEAINTNLLEFSISKATYDLSGIKFENKQVVLDFKKHSLFVSGKLPEGVSVVYTIDGKAGNSTSKAFEHKVVATFVGDAQNYVGMDSMEATIYVDMSWVFISMAVAIVVIGIALSIAMLYTKYRREHPKKIKLKIRSIVSEDLEAKRVATSVKEVLGDDEKELELLEDEDDIMDENAIAHNFIDRIYASDSELKYYYSEVKNELLSYEGVIHTVDRKYEVFYHGPRQIAKLSICNNVLKLYVHLDPEKYDKSHYNHRDMSKFECHARTPLRIDVNTAEALRHAKVFIRILRKKENLKASTSFVRIDYEKFYTLKENFIPKLFKKMFIGDKDKRRERK